LAYVSAWKPRPGRKAIYVGEPAGRRHFEAAGLSLNAYTKGALSPDRVLIVGPGGGQKLAGDMAAVGKWLKEGGHLLARGLDGGEIEAFLPFRIEMKKREHLAAYFESPGMNSLLVGIGPADVHNRDPRALPLVAGGATVIGNGILARSETGNVVFCQLVPW